MCVWGTNFKYSAAAHECLYSINVFPQRGGEGEVRFGHRPELQAFQFLHNMISLVARSELVGNCFHAGASIQTMINELRTTELLSLALSPYSRIFSMFYV